MIKHLFWMFRILIFYIFNLITTIIYSISSLVLFILPFQFKIKYKFITSWSKLFIFTAKIICGLNYKITGTENIPDYPVVVMSNHQSTWDAIAMQVILPPQCWILKKELLKIPFFGWGLSQLKPIAINRKDPNSIKQLIKQGTKRLKDNLFIIIFPEGTRVKPGKNKKFSRSGAALAKKAGVSILPIAHNAGKYWPKGMWIKSPGTIKVTIGKLIPTNNLSAEEITEKAETWINAHKN